MIIKDWELWWKKENKGHLMPLHLKKSSGLKPVLLCVKIILFFLTCRPKILYTFHRRAASSSPPWGCWCCTGPRRWTVPPLSACRWWFDRTCRTRCWTSRKCRNAKRCTCRKSEIFRFCILCHSCYSSVKYKVFYWITSKLFNQPQSKMG